MSTNQFTNQLQSFILPNTVNLLPRITRITRITILDTLDVVDGGG